MLLLPLLSFLYMFVQPIFATLSDIVIYSPTGNVDAAKQLAQKFKEAVEKKYWERVERLKSQMRGEDDWEELAEGATPKPKRTSPLLIPVTSIVLISFFSSSTLSF